MVANNRPWPPADIELLKRLAAEHRSIAFIAAQLGKTYNAIVGKAHRMGISFASVAKPEKPAPDPVLSANLPEERRRRLSPAPRKKVAPPSKVMVAEPPPPAPVAAPVERWQVVAMPSSPKWLGTPVRPSLATAGPMDCRWLVAEPASLLICGDPALAGSSYCGEHHRISYQRMPAKV